MGLQRLQTYRRQSYQGGSSFRRNIYARKCKLCGRRAYSEYCKLCEYNLLQIDEIIKLYTEGTPPEYMDNAIAEFDRIYFSNLRLRVFYNTACEAVQYTVLYPNSPIQLGEPNFST